MKLIRCPEVMPRAFATNDQKLSLFLGGGITNCPDWQSFMIDGLSNLDNLMLVNPRTVSFDAKDGNIRPQNEWERDHLNRVSATMFWFPCETVCPITLFELGYAASAGKMIFVGCDKNYSRKEDVIIQLSLLRPEVVVAESLYEMIGNIREWYFL